MLLLNGDGEIVYEFETETKEEALAYLAGLKAGSNSALREVFGNRKS